MSQIVRGESADCILNFVQDADFICIEGFPGSGKSTSGKSLAKLLDATYIEMDDFLENVDEREFTNYASKIKINELSELVCSLEGKVVIGGCSLRAILKMLKLERKVFYIYIKKVNAMVGNWPEGYFFEDYINGNRDFSPLDKSEYEYMKNYKPHEVSDLIFERLSSD